MEEKQKKRAADAPARPRAKAPGRPAAGKRPAGAKKPAPGKGSAAKRRKRPDRQEGLPLWAVRVRDRFTGLPQRFRGLFGSWFYRIYFPVVGLALVGILVWLNWLNGYAADYEAAQPVHAADEAAQMFVDGDYDRLYALDTSAGEISGGDKGFYVSTLKALTQNGQIEWNASYASGSDEMQYVVTLNGSRFATFTLVPSGQTTAHGNPLWQLGSVTTHIALEEPEATPAPNQVPCRLQAPEGYAITVDGRPLTEADVVRTGVAIYPDGFLPSGVTAPVMTEYGFMAGEGGPAITAADPSGAQVPVRQVSEGNWLCPLREDEAAKAQFSEAMMKLAERIAKYTTADISSSAAMSDVVNDSPAEVTLKAFKNDWAPAHKSERFENMELSDFYVLSDTCMTCHVKFNYILTSRRQNDYPYETEYTFCLARKGDEAKLYNLMFH